MKHILVNKNGQVHAVVVACPFKYTLPREMKAYHDINHDFSKPFDPTNKKMVDCHTHINPKSKDDIDNESMSFAIIRDGIVENCIMWGGAEWLPPMGTMVIPMEKWMGVHDLYDEHHSKFAMHNSRKGKSDKDKTVLELQEDFNAAEVSNNSNIKDELE
jgi:hypothetical protein